MVLCHDRSPYADYKCPRCGFICHIHKSQLPADFPDIKLLSTCQNCQQELIIPETASWIGEN